ncbi:MULTISPECIES: hypothetical protein [Helicobacter]|uniref:Molybdenum-pterin-binding protein n=1 Tax=Helicobacter ibis TaxID=2962633 RepID=A0ABT4VER3_9HELI|nr:MULTISPECIES: hypothetical protein [Helicobacter]MDA3967052.1 hypothetical protein [Helicobacter sp. WB40]MDA3969186.1 hypothetical protein [Helicobacter ibis]
MNKIQAKVIDSKTSGDISRIIANANGLIFSIILLESRKIGDIITLAFKESNILVARNIQGANNIFVANVESCEQDSMFLKLKLKSNNLQIEAITNIDSNFKEGEKVVWHILESEIMIIE